MDSRVCPLLSDPDKLVRCLREGCELYAGNIAECALFRIAQLLDGMAHE